MRITDAQVHIYEKSRPGRPWPENLNYYPDKDHFEVEELLVEMERAGVNRAVLNPPIFEGSRNDLCIQAARDYPERFRIMGRLDIGDDRNSAVLRSWRNEPGMAGVRLSFVTAEDYKRLEDDGLDWFWNSAEEANLPIMIYAPHAMGSVGRIAEKYAGIRFLVDHLGIEAGLRGDAIDPFLQNVIGLQRLENVAVKATCLPRFASDPYPYSSLCSRFRRVLDAYGPRRVFWGSDLTELPCSYEEVISLFVEEFDFLDGEDLEWVMGRGIESWIDW